MSQKGTTDQKHHICARTSLIENVVLKLHLGVMEQAVNTTLPLSPYKVVMVNVLVNSRLFTHLADTEEYWHSFGVIFVALWRIKFNIKSPFSSSFVFTG